MASFTYTEIYNLLRNNELVIEYNHNDELSNLNIRGSLMEAYCPQNDEDDVKTLHTSIKYAEWKFSGDSDGALDKLTHKAMQSGSPNIPPNWIKFWSSNYKNWINIKISNIKSVSIIEES